MVGYRVTKRFVKNGLERRLRSDIFTEEEAEHFIEWVIQMGMRDKSSELAVFQLLAPLAFAEQPLCLKLPDLKGKIPIAFIYGEYDWVTRECADKMLAEGKIDGEVFITSLSGHHLYVEAATECVSSIIKFTHGEQAQNDFICTV